MQMVTTCVHVYVNYSTQQNKINLTSIKMSQVQSMMKFNIFSFVQDIYTFKFIFI
jgi:hypothetical protein